MKNKRRRRLFYHLRIIASGEGVETHQPPPLLQTRHWYELFAKIHNLYELLLNEISYIMDTVEV